MNRTFFTMLLAASLLTACATEFSPNLEGATDGTLTGSDASEAGTAEGTDGSETGDAEGETDDGSTGDGDGDGDGDGETGTAQEPIAPYYPCTPIEMHEGIGQCADGPMVLYNPDSQIVPHTCVLGFVSPGPGQQEVTGMYCLPLRDSEGDGTSHKSGCDQWSGGGFNTTYTGCLHLACVESDLFAMDWCEIDPAADNQWPSESWDDFCCTRFCETDDDCLDGTMKCDTWTGSIKVCVKKD